MRLISAMLVVVLLLCGVLQQTMALDKKGGSCEASCREAAGSSSVQCKRCCRDVRGSPQKFRGGMCQGHTCRCLA
ncbi:hypothetical protein RvY_03467-2 [Ramazzottius varieornatus]|uniref:Invertebrate defensins family profile domain-containing protein n=1 Tax=Ramazzottius varieornatus TaxID=947166 RepID=A0A1D1UN75_RAMVA|nr:hypothetical protein RvY_03467-2 [Ramazzottius varieornatus]